MIKPVSVTGITHRVGCYRNHLVAFVLLTFPKLRRNVIVDFVS